MSRELPANSPGKGDSRTPLAQGSNSSSPEQAQPGVGHLPVLMDQVLRLLDPRSAEIAVDGTAGRGGHAVELARRVGLSGKLVAFDLDADNLAFTKSRVQREAPGTPCEFIHGSFVSMPRELKERSICADVLLADLGFSSTQMDAADRGFSFRFDGPLDMRFDRSKGPTAADLIARLSERELADLIFRLGEDPFARRIASKLVRARAVESIETTTSLARLVREAYGSKARFSRMDPATRTFMALRIAVNSELEALQALLEVIALDANRLGAGGTGEWLNPGARIGVISFHSLEDRMVKHSFASMVREGLADALSRKPVTADEKEIAANPRARSAKLRVIRLKATEVRAR